MKDEIYDKFKNTVRKIGINKLILILLCGVLLLVISMPVEKKTDKLSTGIQSVDDNTDYECYIEQKLEERLKEVKGIEDASVILRLNSDEIIEGVIIVAKGTYDSKTKLEITEGISSLLGVPSHKIKILDMK